MSVTAFLSLWISNTASSSMMLPIVVALVKQLARYNPAFSNKKNIQSVSYNKVKGKCQILIHSSQMMVKNNF